ncbi:MAG: aminoacyl-tRNA hydrolase [Cyclobacteriaceae bacterium]|nr:aminoacyl-tRNA hydrolase [Cyclobacteriaceae bacterium]
MMTVKKLTSDVISNELEFGFSRSGGPGGQHVNKVNTKVTLRWDVANSQLLDEEQKALLFKKLGKRLTNDGVLVLSSQEERSQLANKEDVQAKLDELLIKAFAKKKKRKPTKPTKASVEKRLEEKKKQGEKKKWRRGE